MLNQSVILAGVPGVEVAPGNIAKRQYAAWRGLQVETVELTRQEPFEYKYYGDRHLLVAAEAGSRWDGETFIDGLPKSTLRDLAQRLTFVPAGRRFYSWHKPKVLSRAVFIHIDPKSPVLPPEEHFSEAELKPGLLFRDHDLWETALKLKGSLKTPGEAIYAEALEVVLAHELVRKERAPKTQAFAKGGLAAWQKKRIAEFIAEHVTEQVPLLTLAEITGLSPYHFARTFKTSFGMPPHRYVMNERIERAKQLLTNRNISITEIGLKLGFSDTSTFTATFGKMMFQTPSQYRRSLG